MKKQLAKKANDFTTPLFLFKAGQTAMELKEFSKAEHYLQKLKKTILNLTKVKI